MKRGFIFCSALVSLALVSAQKCRSLLDEDLQNLESSPEFASLENLPKAPLNGFERPKSTGKIVRACGCLERTEEQFTPNLRQISNKVFNQAADDNIPALNKFNTFGWTWGQFLDHDIVLSNNDPASKDFNITMEDNFEPITVKRVQLAGRDANNCRQPKNVITADLDGSTVYGDFFNRIDGLRERNSCKMRTVNGFLPEIISPVGPSFLAGDIRVSEHIVLASVHHLLVFEHNSICDLLNSAELRDETASWSEDDKFWKARQVVIAVIQKITYAEWLPMVLGPDMYKLFNEATKTSGYTSRGTDVVAEFSAAGFRFGHTMVNNEIGGLSLKQLFFNDTLFKVKGLSGVVLDSINAPAQNVDNKIVFDLRNILFGKFINDLVSINMFRARELGMPAYEVVKKCYNSKGVSSYKDTVDVFPGILSEAKAKTVRSSTFPSSINRKSRQLFESLNSLDSSFYDTEDKSLAPPTVTYILAEQFSRFRLFDTNFYTRPAQVRRIGKFFMQYVKDTTFGALLKRHTNLNIKTCRFCGFRTDAAL